MSYHSRHRRLPGWRRSAIVVTLVAAFAAAMSLLALSAPGAKAATSSLPAYPATTLLDLNSQNCVTDDVIMNDPVASPITDTYGSDGSPVVTSQAAPPVHYYLWYLNPSNVWVFGPPPGTQINPNTGVISAYNGFGIFGVAPNKILGDVQGPTPVPAGSVTYTIRDHGKDTLGAIGTEQYQVNVDNSGGGVVSVTYEGNDFDNANGELTIGLNAASNDSTKLTLAAVAGSLNIPGSTPVTFTLKTGSVGWNITNNVLTGTNASDPEIVATTANHDVVFFTLSGISTDSGGVFFTNNDANPCVNPVADTVGVVNPGAQTTTVGSGVSLAISASTPNGDTVTSYTATGLPAGLSINGSTGVISGTATTAGTSTVTVTASDSDESGSATFAWTVSPVVVPPPPPSGPHFGNFVNQFGSGFNAFKDHASYNSIVASWPATQHDGASHFLYESEGANFRLEWAPNGIGTGWCVSNATGTALVFRACNTGVWQQFRVSGVQVVSIVSGSDVRANGNGAQLTVGLPNRSYSWKEFASLPA